MIRYGISHYPKTIHAYGGCPYSVSGGHGGKLQNHSRILEVCFEQQSIFEVCSLSNQSPKGVLGVSVYETTWAVFGNKGYFKENVQNIFRSFYTEWLPFSGYEYAGLPDVEVYSICKETPVTGHSEMWIAIKRRRRTKHVSFKTERRPLSDGRQERKNFSKKQYHIPTAS